MLGCTLLREGRGALMPLASAPDLWFAVVLLWPRGPNAHTDHGCCSRERPGHGMILATKLVAGDLQHAIGTWVPAGARDEWSVQLNPLDRATSHSPTRRREKQFLRRAA